MSVPIRALVVDDAVEYAAMVAELLRSSGEWTLASIDTVSTYDAAFRALSDGRYDVAFVDYLLGAVDGVALLREIRQRGVDTAVVILTAYGAEEVAVDAMKAGAADYLPKTQVSVETLDRTIRHALALRSGERQRQHAEQALRASEERFRALVENSSDVLVLVDVERRVQYIAASSERHLGWTPDQVQGRSIFEFVHPDDRGQLAGGSTDALAGPGGSLRVDVRVRHADGGFRIMEAVAVNRIDEPSVGAIVINLRDITDRRRLEDELRQAQKLDAVGQLAGGLAHDFTNLLSAILGYCDLVLSDVPQDDPKRRDLEEIRAAGERASSLTRQLLAFARRQVLQPQVIDVNALIEQMQRLLRRLLPANVDLVTQLAPDIARVRADPASIEQILISLTVHARDAVPRGGRVTIETSGVAIDDAESGRRRPAMPVGSYVRIAVHDTGDGMDAATRQRIFEPFFAASESGKAGGMGLAAVHGIVQQNGGWIAVDSEPGGGTVFSMFFPQAAALAMPQPADSGEVVDASSGGETVLVVEEDDAVRALAREVLRRQGYAVLEARHGVDALRAAERHRDPIHLLVTDTVTAHLSGPQIAERLTSTRPGIRVLFLSGQAAGVTTLDVEPHAAVLRKPFTPEALARRVRSLLGS